jgi:heterodisulfide reductase subunit C
MDSKQIAFIIFMLTMLGVFGYTAKRLMGFIKLTKSGFPIDRISERISLTLKVAFGQTKILDRPIIGIIHALVWWGFLIITVGTAEMIIDGITGAERILLILGPIYKIIMGSGDIFAAIIITAVTIFLIRRHIIKVKRFDGVEMDKKKGWKKADATIALSMIMLLMISLIGMNIGYVKLCSIGEITGDSCNYFPISGLFIGLVPDSGAHLFHEINWWLHIALVFIFMNILPYSKHFHVIMSVPNVFLSRLDPLTKIQNMPSVTKEVDAMMNPEAAFAPPPEGGEMEMPRFGVKDVEDVSWQNYLDSLTCTECGRCTSVCPANTTGKLLSPRKIMVDTRKRMNDKGPSLVKDNEYTDNKALVGDYISKEELFACTTCNACVDACPVNIDQVSMIMDMRRYLIMEEANSPSEWNMMFTNIENNGAPWQFSPTDRMNWAENIVMKA